MKFFKTVLKWLGIITLLMIVLGVSFYMIYARPLMEKMKHTTTIQYDKELTLILGGGGNSGILTSDSLVIVIDTKMDEAGEILYKQVKQLARNKPVLVINTHFHPDHSKGNEFYKGQTIIAGGDYTKEAWIKEAGEKTLPTKWLKDRMDIKMGNETVTVINFARNVHTQSDIVVYLHQRKMLFGGDVILNKQAPVTLGNADPEGYMKALDLVQRKFDIQKIVPGHGALGGTEIIQNFRQYFDDMKIAASDGSKKDSLIAKYKDWTQIPFVMSPGSTISAIKKKM